METLLAESLTPAAPVPVAALPGPLAATMNPRVRSLMVIAACIALGLSFFLGVKYERG